MYVNRFPNFANFRESHTYKIALLSIYYQQKSYVTIIAICPVLDHVYVDTDKELSLFA
jgi:hypothetical protein